MVISIDFWQTLMYHGLCELHKLTNCAMRRAMESSCHDWLCFGVTSQCNRARGDLYLGMRLLCGWDELRKEVTKLWACHAFSKNERDSSTLGELVHGNMIKSSKYGCASRFKVQHLEPNSIENLIRKPTKNLHSVSNLWKSSVLAFPLISQ
jgi:hypothetical protein